MRRGPEFLFISHDQETTVRNLRHPDDRQPGNDRERLLVVEQGCLVLRFTKIEAAIGNHRGHDYNAVRIPAGVSVYILGHERGHSSPKTTSLWVVGEENVRAALVVHEVTAFNGGPKMAKLAAPPTL